MNILSHIFELCEKDEDIEDVVHFEKKAPMTFMISQRTFRVVDFRAFEDKEDIDLGLLTFFQSFYRFLPSIEAVVIDEMDLPLWLDVKIASRFGAQETKILVEKGFFPHKDGLFKIPLS